MLTAALFVSSYYLKKFKCSPMKEQIIRVKYGPIIKSYSTVKKNEQYNVDNFQKYFVICNDQNTKNTN